MTVLHAFAGSPTDGGYPYAALVQATDGNFYGTTYFGIRSRHGLRDDPRRCRDYPALVQFCSGWGLSRRRPRSGDRRELLRNDAQGGAALAGTVFRITPAGTFTVLHAFPDGVEERSNSSAALLQATDGNFYGTTCYGARSGTVFMMTPTGSVTNLYAFGSGTTNGDGVCPQAALVQATDGNLYEPRILAAPPTKARSSGCWARRGYLRRAISVRERRT